MRRAIHRRDGWVLGYCLSCGRVNYVEPHGTTAECQCSSVWTEHSNVPSTFVDPFRLTYNGPSRLVAGVRQ